MADPGTAVAKKPTVYDKLTRPSDPFNDRKRAFELASLERQTKMVASAMKAVANSSWGSSMSDPVLQEAMCVWALNKGVDVALHIHILGGRIYLNAQYYIDRLVTLPDYRRSYVKVIAPCSDRTPPQDLFDPKQLAQLKKKHDKRNMERWDMQDEHEVPEEINSFPKTAAAVMCYIEMYDRNGEVILFTGWNKAGSYGRKSKRNPSKGVDPIGDGDPVKTATTRAYRVACKTIPNFPLDDASKDGELTDLNDRIEAQRQERKAREKEEADRLVIGDMQVEIDDLLDRPEMDPAVAEACQAIYNDWIAGAFQNISIEQVQQLLNELRAGMGSIANEEGLCPLCNASIDMGEPHGEDCPTELSVIEDVVDGVTGEVIEEGGS